MAVVMRIQGADDLLKKLQALDTAVAKKARVAALKAGAQIVQADAGRRAVRSQRPGPEGHMADHIIVKTTVNRKNETTVSVGPDSEHWWGLLVEVGYRILHRRTGAVIATIPARPFLRPALDENRTAVEGAIKTVLRDAVNRVARG